MIRGLAVGILAALLLGLGASTAAARLLPGCGNPADSALNQYCETIPAAKGPQTARPGTPALGIPVSGGPSQGPPGSHGVPAALHHRVVKVPAKEGASAPAGNLNAGRSAFPLWLILLLAALALALVTVAIERRRRGGPRPPVPGEAPA